MMNIRDLINQISTWRNRAAMAYQQNNYELCRQALEKCWQFQKSLAELEGTAAPTRPLEPHEAFADLSTRRPDKPGSDPHQPTKVPRLPLPNAGAGEIALPLPEKDDDETD